MVVFVGRVGDPWKSRPAPASKVLMDTRRVEASELQVRYLLLARWENYMDTRTCTKCKETKELSLFTKSKQRSGGRGSWCKECMNNHVKDRYTNNESVREARRTYQSYNRPNYVRHNISKARYEELLSVNNGFCQICKVREATVIDHDHACCSGTFSCGECVRGVICVSCNRLLGFAGDNPKTLKNAIEYLGPLE